MSFIETRDSGAGKANIHFRIVKEDFRMRISRIHSANLAPISQLRFNSMRFWVISIFAINLLYSSSQEGSLQAQQEPVRKLQQPTGHENHRISLSQAAAFTKTFRISTGNDRTTIKGEFFGKDALVAALAQDECIGLRFYYGMEKNGTPILIFVGVNKSGEDMIEGFIGELGLLCPPICPKPNPLNDVVSPILGESIPPLLGHVK